MSLRITIANNKRTVTMTSVTNTVSERTPKNPSNERHDQHLVLGDSMVRGIEIPKSRCIALGGAKILDLQIELNKINPIAHPKTITILAGTNNLYPRPAQERSTEVDVANDLDTLIHTLNIKFPVTKVAVINILPRRDRPGALAEIIFCNRVIQSHLTATPNRIHWIPCFRELLDDAEKVNRTCYKSGNFHLSKKGRSILSEKIEKFQTSHSNKQKTARREKGKRRRVSTSPGDSY